MKKLTLFLALMVAVCLAFQACSDTKSYADMMEEEDNAVAAFIEKHNIKVISQTDFFAQDSTTNVAENEFVHLASDVYMQIVDKGSTNPADTVQNNDLILVRFSEYDIVGEDTTLSNLDSPNYVDEFKYTVTSTSIAGIFMQGYMLMAYGSQVPPGWLVPLPYVRNMAHVRLIIPHKMGHTNAQKAVSPYYYDIQKFQIWE